MLAFVAVVPLVAAIGGIAVDCMHYNDALGELQRATDAAAIAGAQDLNNYVGSKNLTATAVSNANEEPVNFALKVASLNPVDGPVGLWNSSERTVTATIRYDATLGGTVNRPNRCDVTGQIVIRSFFAKLFGNFQQNVRTSSSAGLKALNTLYGGFAPLLVSWKDPDSNGLRLKDIAMGTSYTIVIKNNQVSNSVWILNSGKDDTQAIHHLGNPVAYPGTNLPTVSIGDYIQSDNGQKSSGKYFDELIGKDIGLIITGDSVNSDYLAKGQPVHPVMGFIGFHVTGADTSAGKNGYSLTGTIEPLPMGGDYLSSGGTPPSSMSTFSPYLVRLIQ